MARSPIRVWFFDSGTPIEKYQDFKPDFHLIIKNISKSTLRANYFIVDPQLENPKWILDFLEGNSGDFFIEGSGRYQLANINTNEQEAYFSKSNFALPSREVFFSYQGDNEETSTAIEDGLRKTIDDINPMFLNKQLSLKTAKDDNPGAGAIDQHIRHRINSCMVFIADLTPLHHNQDQGKFFYNSNVLIEVGYAIATKKKEQVLLILPTFGTEWSKEKTETLLPFDIRNLNTLHIKNIKDLPRKIDKELKKILEKLNVIKQPD